MLSDIKAGKITRVVVKDMSRFGRDYLQVGMYTDVVFPDYGVHFVAVNDGVDSTRGESEFTAIRNVFNEMYARDTSKKIRASFQSKGKSGEHLTFHAPYGYRKDPNDRGHWIVDEEAAAVVQTIYTLCVDGLGPSQIARWLYENKILTPSEHFLESGYGKPRRMTKTPCWWTTETVSSILERVDYLGHTVNFKTYSKSYKNKKRHWSDPNDWAVFENTHEAIIEESTFAIVQNIRKTRKRLTRSGKLNEYSGLVFCAKCGGKMYLSRRGDGNEKGDRFVCMTYRKGGGNCVAHTILKTVVDRIVLSNLREAIAYIKDNEDVFIKEAADLAEQARDREIAGGKATLTKSERRIAELDEIIKRLYEDNVTGKLTDERFIKLSRDYEREQNTLKSLCVSLREDVKKQEKSKQNVKSFIATAKKYTDIQELDTTILHEFIDRINVSPMDKSSRTRDIEIVYNFIGAFDFTKTSKPSLELAGGFEQRKIGIGQDQSDITEMVS